MSPLGVPLNVSWSCLRSSGAVQYISGQSGIKLWLIRLVVRLYLRAAYIDKHIHELCLNIHNGFHDV